MIFGRAIWELYSSFLATDEIIRLQHPSMPAVEKERQKALAKIESAGFDQGNPLAVLDASLDFLVLREARNIDHEARKARLAALRHSLADGKPALIKHEVEDFLARNALEAPSESAERAMLAKYMVRGRNRGA